MDRKGKIYGKGLNAISMRQLSNGQYQVTPSYNQVTKGEKREYYLNEKDAISRVNKLREGAGSFSVKNTIKMSLKMPNRKIKMGFGK